MKRFSAVLYMVLALSSYATEIFADTWPKMKDGEQVKCAEAFQIAKVMFKSTEFYLYAPPTIPKGFQSKLVLGPQALDISGGNALESDDGVFQKLPIGDEIYPRNIYWQKAASYGYRLVLAETARGWRGDTYSLFTVGEAIQSDEFLAEWQNHSPPKFAFVMLDSWQPPLIFQGIDTGRFWIVDVGQPNQFLADWRIYAVEPTGAEHRCTVQFRPDVERATSLLPQVVLEFARLLDQTLGSGKNEGTLQPTSRLRLTVEHAWANAALRPWATGEPYNTREEVDACLKQWSQTGATYLKVYQDIQRQYPLAEQSLAEYYQRNFNRSAAEAKSLSAYVLDIALRSHYAFHSGDPDHYFRNTNSQSNPWRNK